MLIWLYIGCISIGSSIVVKGIKEIKEHNENNQEELDSSHGSFTEMADGLEGTNGDTIPKFINLWKNFFVKVNDIGSDFEENMPYYDDMVTFAQYTKKILQPSSDIYNGNIIRLLNNHLYEYENERSEEYYKNIICYEVDLEHFTESLGIPFIYIQPPVKICEFDKKLPLGIKDYRNENLSLHLKLLENEGIDILDLRDTLHEQGLDHYSMFYKTDHHWNIEAGLWAANQISEVISEDFGIELQTDLLQIENYKDLTFEDKFLGSHGRTITRAYADPESFSILIPKFDTDFRVESPDYNLDLTGSLEETMINWGQLNKYLESDTENLYAALLYGNRPIMKITNHNKPDGLKVVMIRDSFSLAVAPYLANVLGELHLIDMRERLGGYTGSVRAYIEEVNPDLVCMMYMAPEYNEYK